MTDAGPQGKPPRQRASTTKYKAALRNAKRRNAMEPEINFLNITAMLDIMTIILVFLLKTVGESSASIPQSDDLKLPSSVIKTQPSQDGVVVTISKSQILVDNDMVLKLPSRESQIQSGVGARHKRKGPNDLYITPLGTRLQAARKTDKAVRAAKEQPDGPSEAIVVADGTIPFRTLSEVLFTMGQSEFGKYHLMVIQSKTRAE